MFVCYNIFVLTTFFYIYSIHKLAKSSKNRCHSREKRGGSNGHDLRYIQVSPENEWLIRVSSLKIVCTNLYGFCMTNIPVIISECSFSCRMKNTEDSRILHSNSIENIELNKHEFKVQLTVWNWIWLCWISWQSYHSVWLCGDRLSDVFDWFFLLKISLVYDAFVIVLNENIKW